MKKNNSEITRNGVIYVTVKECAQRLCLSESAIRQRLTNHPELLIKFPEYRRFSFVNWEKTNEIFSKPSTHQGVKEFEKRKLKKRINNLTDNQSGIIKKESKKIKPTNPIKADDKKVKSVQNLKGINNEIIGFFDTEDPNNADLWILDDFGNPIILENGLHAIDWKKANTKATAMIHNLQYQQELDSVISTKLFLEVLIRVTPLYVRSLQEMPDNFASRFKKFLKEKFNIEISEEQYNSLREIFVSTADKTSEEIIDGTNEILKQYHSDRILKFNK